MPESQPPKRRWYQYSLRTLFVLVTLVAMACSWYAYEMRKAAERRAAVAEIIERGGSVAYYGAAHPFRGKPPRWFSWLRKLHGDEHLGNVLIVRFDGTQVTDAGLVHLKSLPNIEAIDLLDTRVTDAGLAHLKSLRSLQWLRFDGTEVSDAGLVHLEDLTDLEAVYLRAMQVTNEGVKKLQEALPNCQIYH
ncbi:MAG: hypothetical protein HQ567_23340 [Candidatus Nealsonbacteria bacterium]|nr:hypothetical protein [Candidatus Nealsonbacteria bacterium]